MAEMISLWRFFMFWKTDGGDRRTTSQHDRESFDRRKRAMEQDPDRVDVMRRVEFLEAESSLYLKQHPDVQGQKR